MSSSTYLQDIPLDSAWQIFRSELEKRGLWTRLGYEEIPLDQFACGRVLADPVIALRPSPHYHAAAMDGFAIRAQDSNGARPANPIDLVQPGQVLYVDTGDPLPSWADAVIPIEVVEALTEFLSPVDKSVSRSAAVIRIREGVTPWSHVRPMGEDLVTSQLILASGTELRPADLGVAAAGGASRLRVARKPVVAILPTGSELVAIGEEARAGEITEFNSMVLAAQVDEWGGVGVRYPVSPDDFDLICSRIQEAAEKSDIVLVNAGSSAGSEDYTARAVSELGVVLVHGVAVRPGHPVIIGFVRRKSNSTSFDEVPVIGVPGYPVSAALTGEIFVEPLMRKWLGLGEFQPSIVKAKLTRKVNSPAGDDDYLRVVVGEVNHQLLAAPLNRGAGVITSLSKADGIVIIPRHTQGLEAGATVDVRLYRGEADLKHTILTIGSHDLTLDVLAQALSGYQRRLVSSNVGSLGGLIALSRGEAHFAGSHLLDPETGEYNLSYIARYLKDIPVRLFDWVERVQGLVVAHDNPLKIAGMADLWREEVTFINRQKGSGTRVLLDDAIRRLGKTAQGIKGYEREEYTHLGVAAAVSSGRADCGLAVQAAASALDLDFIPLFSERYQLVIPVSSLETPLLDPLFKLMQDSGFKSEIERMPGYDARRMGEEINLA